MDKYLIGAGAVLTAGPEGSITGATLHAQTDPLLAASVDVAVVDFESGRPAELSRILIVIKGWSRPRFGEAVIKPLLEARECSLGEVMAQLAAAAGVSEVHVFSRWAPDRELNATADAAGFHLVMHPLETIEQAALVFGQRVSRWRSPLQAA